VAADPYSTEAHAQLAWSPHRRRRRDEALAEIRRALEYSITCQPKSERDSSTTV
jgi:hypothetical protein